MKFIILAIATVCIAATNGKKPDVFEQGITTATNYEQLLQTASGEAGTVNQQLTTILETLGLVVDAMIGDANSLIAKMKNGPAACNNADKVQSHLDENKEHFESLQNRDVGKFMTPKCTKIVEDMRRNEADIRAAIEDCGQPCEVDTGKLNQLQQAMIASRKKLFGETTALQGVIYAGVLKDNSVFVKHTKDFQKCVREQRK